jgi:uncharacterized protein YndB with AHSA1/START domain
MTSSGPWSPTITPNRITASVHISAPPERVYEYFTRADAIVQWMGEFALLDPEPGGQFTINIQGAPVRGRFLELDPPRRLLISWGYAGSDQLPPGASAVEIRLTEQHDGTRVELEHRNLPAEQEPAHTTGWTHYLARLAIAASGANAGPDPGMPAPPPLQRLPRVFVGPPRAQ